MSNKVENIAYTNFGRIGKVELWQNGEKMEINTLGLDFKFRTNKMFQAGDCAIANSATVGILGLTRNSVDNICKYCDMKSYINQGISIRVCAGYQTQGNDIDNMTIFHLPVAGATPSMPPDNWVTLTANYAMYVQKYMEYNYYSSLEEYNKLVKEKKLNLLSLLKKIATDFKIQWLPHGNVEAFAQGKSLTRPFSCHGNISSAIKELIRQFGYINIIQNNCLSDKGLPQYDLYIKYANRNSSDGKWQEENPYSQHEWKIDKNNSMIGMPSYVSGVNEHKFITVRTLLNPGYRRGDKIILTSDIATALTGNYSVRTVQHIGHLRGNEWYSDLECLEI